MMREQREWTYREFRSVVQALADELEASWEKQKADRTIPDKDLVDRAGVILTDIREKLLEREVVKRCDLGKDIKLDHNGWQEIDMVRLDLPRAAELWGCLWFWEAPDGQVYARHDLLRRGITRKDVLWPDSNWRIAGEGEIRCKVLEFLRWYVQGCPGE